MLQALIFPLLEALTCHVNGLIQLSYLGWVIIYLTDFAMKRQEDQVPFIPLLENCMMHCQKDAAAELCSQVLLPFVTLCRKYQHEKGLKIYLFGNAPGNNSSPYRRVFIRVATVILSPTNLSFTFATRCTTIIVTYISLYGYVMVAVRL